MTTPATVGLTLDTGALLALDHPSKAVIMQARLAEARRRGDLRSRRSRCAGMARAAAGPPGSVDQVVRRGHRDHDSERGPNCGFHLRHHRPHRRCRRARRTVRPRPSPRGGHQRSRRHCPHRPDVAADPRVGQRPQGSAFGVVARSPLELRRSTGYRDCSAASSLRNLDGLAAVPEMGGGAVPSPPSAAVGAARRRPPGGVLLATRDEAAPADRTPR